MVRGANHRITYKGRNGPTVRSQAMTKLGNAAKAIFAIVNAVDLYYGKVSNAGLYLPNYWGEIDFGAISEADELGEVKDLKIGEKTPFQKNIQLRTGFTTERKFLENAEFLLEKLVAFRDALTKAEQDIANNPSIPPDEKLEFPDELKKQIADAESGLNSISTILKRNIEQYSAHCK